MQERILLVDDEPAVLDALATYFRREGFEVATAATMQETLDLAAEKSYQLVILDIGLAQENGLDLLPEVKQALPKARVMMLTGLGYDPDLMDNALRLGADGYIAKGVAMDELKLAVNRALERSE
jgi:DNA-binding response OmpR family regulator